MTRKTNISHSFQTRLATSVGSCKYLGFVGLPQPSQIGDMRRQMSGIFLFLFFYSLYAYTSSLATSPRSFRCYAPVSFDQRVVPFSTFQVHGFQKGFHYVGRRFLMQITRQRKHSANLAIPMAVHCNWSVFPYTRTPRWVYNVDIAQPRRGSRIRCVIIIIS